jgi:hypothetical protein
MEFKWLMICVAVSISAISAGAGISEWSRYQSRGECFATYANTDRTADEIEQICR